MFTDKEEIQKLYNVSYALHLQAVSEKQPTMVEKTILISLTGGLGKAILKSNIKYLYEHLLNNNNAVKEAINQLAWCEPIKNDYNEILLQRNDF